MGLFNGGKHDKPEKVDKYERHYYQQQPGSHRSPKRHQQQPLAPIGGQFNIAQAGYGGQMQPLVGNAFGAQGPYQQQQPVYGIANGQIIDGSMMKNYSNPFTTGALQLPPGFPTSFPPVWLQPQQGQMGSSFPQQMQQAQGGYPPILLPPGAVQPNMMGGTPYNMNRGGFNMYAGFDQSQMQPQMMQQPLSNGSPFGYMPQF